MSFEFCRPAERKYVVRVVLPDGVHELTALVRTMLLVLHRAGSLTVHRDDLEGMCFDVLPSANVDTKVWADSVANDFSHYGFNAVRAPECPDTLEDRQRLQQSSKKPPTLTDKEFEEHMAALFEWGHHCLR